MRLLFEIDKKDYNQCTYTLRRDSARAIVIRDGLVGMIYSQKRDFYKFPGGGIEAGETARKAMIREALEEAGLVVIPETVQEYGMVHRVQRSLFEPEQCFVQNNYYYLCRIEDEIQSQQLEQDEQDDQYTLIFVDPRVAIETNYQPHDNSFHTAMLERDARVLECLLEDEII